MQKQKNIHAIFILSAILLIFISQRVEASVARIASSPFLYNFNNSGLTLESDQMSQSSSPYWWVNSGAYLKIENGRGATNQENLPFSDFWRVLYSVSNPIDTDNGFHPQNIFRLLTRSSWTNFRQEAYFIVKADNLSDSSNRNVSNGILLMSRYLNSDNLYYAGIRVDGSAVIKKKKNGVYYTLAQVKNIYPGTYNKTTDPNLIPKNKWVGLRAEIKNLSGGKVEISLYLDKMWQGNWQLVTKAVDDGNSYGGAALTSAGFAGIRTDFMDVEFENFRLLDI